MDGIGYIPTFGGSEHRSGTREQAASALAISGLADAIMRALAAMNVTGLPFRQSMCLAASSNAIAKASVLRLAIGVVA